MVWGWVFMSSTHVSGHSFMFIYYSSWVSINMSFMSLIVYSSIYYSEKNYTLKMLSFMVTIVALVFFGSVSLVLFYMMYEILMLPVMIMIYLFGSQPEKISSIYYAVVYTGSFSLPFLYEVVGLEGWMVDIYLSPLQQLVLVGLFLSKSPIFFLHVWLPKTHVEAPTSASMLLAGILLKVGIYGFMKMSILFNTSMIMVVFMSLTGLMMMPLITCMSVESKVMTANSSITHMNLVIYGVNILSNVSMSGSYLLSLSHGFASSLMFSFVGMMYSMNGTRVLFFLSSVNSWSMLFGVMVSVVYLGNAGTPPFMSFWGEVLLLVGAFSSNSLLVGIISINFLYSFYYSVYMLIHFSKMGGSVRADTGMLMTLFVGGLLMGLFVVFVL